jgi:hypothetical protein
LAIGYCDDAVWYPATAEVRVHATAEHLYAPDRKVDIKDNHLGIKLIPMISTWDQVDPIFPVRQSENLPLHCSSAAAM